MTAPVHLPVLLRELLAGADPSPGQRWVDGTFGRGGHTRAFLERGVGVLALDRDLAAVPFANELSREFPGLFTFHRTNFSAMKTAISRVGWEQVDGVLLDLGVSSPQLDTPERGFSFRHEAPLDMRMDQEQSLTAAQLVNSLSEEDLADLFFQLGDERESRRIARAIIKRRQTGPLQTTQDLAQSVASALPHRLHGRTHPATKVFQALRIAVNSEKESLEAALPAALDLIKSGGVIAVISFHSGEDRYVKNFLRDRWRPPEADSAPVRCLSKVERYMPSEEELAENPRARSARLRIGWKLGELL